MIGEVDFSSALTTVHPKAIYLHQGQQYHVERLDFDERKAYVKRVDVDYYTDAIRYTQVRVLEIAEEERASARRRRARAHGDVLVRSQVVGFKKIKFFTNENVGDGQTRIAGKRNAHHRFLDHARTRCCRSLPFALSRPAERHVRPAARAGIDGDAAADVRPARPGHRHRRTPASPGRRNRIGEEHPPAEPLRHGAKMKEFFEPNLYLYDAYPGGIGFSEPLYRVHDLLLRRTRELIAACPCEKGCPSCVGPAGEKSERAKEAALAILDHLCG